MAAEPASPSRNAVPDSHWISEGKVQRFRKGDLLVPADTPLDDWLAISHGVVCLSASVSVSESVTVGALWAGDVIGADSPVGQARARYDVRALVDGLVLRIPMGVFETADMRQALRETRDLRAATSERLQRQTWMRLAGNGLQRLMGVLSTLALAIGGADVGSVSLRVTQSMIGELAGLSRRQVWIYLGQLAEHGWCRTDRTRLVLEHVEAWRSLPATVARNGLGDTSTIERCHDALSRIVVRRGLDAR
jgi:CRP-like cAMP-binding protein